jgi:hypothetical protein
MHMTHTQLLILINFLPRLHRVFPTFQYPMLLNNNSKYLTSQIPLSHLFNFIQVLFVYYIYKICFLQFNIVLISPGQLLTNIADSCEANWDFINYRVLGVLQLFRAPQLYGRRHCLNNQ